MWIERELAPDLVDSFTNLNCGAPQVFKTVSIGADVYFLRVTSASSPGLIGQYFINATLSADIDIDSTAANAWTLSGDLKLGAVLGTQFDSASDEDWYKFVSPAAGRFAVIETWRLAPNVDTAIEIYAPPTTQYGRTGELDALSVDTSGQGLGHWMLRDDDGAAWYKGSRLAFLTPVPGTYYVRVVNEGTEPGRYHVTFTLETGATSGWQSFP